MSKATKESANSLIINGNKYSVTKTNSNYLGKPEYGSLYTAKKEKPGKGEDTMFCIKQINKASGIDPKIIRMETKVMENLRKYTNPHLLPLIEQDEDDNSYYMVMPYCNMGTLTDYLQKSPVKSEEEAIHYCRQICHAVKFLHSKNVSLQGLRTDDIWITKANGNINMGIADYGLSKRIDECAGLQCSESVIATRAPEIYNGTECFESDVYSIGCILYKMLCNREFLSAHGKSIADAQRLLTLVDVKALWPLSEFTMSILEGCLQYECTARMKMSELDTLMDLEHLYENYRKINLDSKSSTTVINVKARAQQSCANEANNEIIKMQLELESMKETVNKLKLNQKNDTEQVSMKMISQANDYSKAFTDMKQQIRKMHDSINAKANEPKEATYDQGIISGLLLQMKELKNELNARNCDVSELNTNISSQIAQLKSQMNSIISNNAVGKKESEVKEEIQFKNSQIKAENQSILEMHKLQLQINNYQEENLIRDSEIEKLKEFMQKINNGESPSKYASPSKENSEVSKLRQQVNELSKLYQSCEPKANEQSEEKIPPSNIIKFENRQKLISEDVKKYSTIYKNERLADKKFLQDQITALANNKQDFEELSKSHKQLQENVESLRNECVADKKHLQDQITVLAKAKQEFEDIKTVIEEHENRNEIEFKKMKDITNALDQKIQDVKIENADIDLIKKYNKLCVEELNRLQLQINDIVDKINKLKGTDSKKAWLNDLNWVQDQINRLSTSMGMDVKSSSKSPFKSGFKSPIKSPMRSPSYVPITDFNQSQMPSDAYTKEISEIRSQMDITSDRLQKQFDSLNEGKADTKQYSELSTEVSEIKRYISGKKNDKKLAELKSNNALHEMKIIVDELRKGTQETLYNILEKIKVIDSQIANAAPNYQPNSDVDKNRDMKIKQLEDNKETLQYQVLHSLIAQLDTKGKLNEETISQLILKLGSLIDDNEVQKSEIEAINKMIASNEIAHHQALVAANDKIQEEIESIRRNILTKESVNESHKAGIQQQISANLTSIQIANDKLKEMDETKTASPYKHSSSKVIAANDQLIQDIQMQITENYELLLDANEKLKEDIEKIKEMVINACNSKELNKGVELRQEMLASHNILSEANQSLKAEIESLKKSMLLKSGPNGYIKHQEMMQTKISQIEAEVTHLKSTLQIDESKLALAIEKILATTPNVISTKLNSEIEQIRKSISLLQKALSTKKASECQTQNAKIKKVCRETANEEIEYETSVEANLKAIPTLQIQPATLLSSAKKEKLSSSDLLLLQKQDFICHYFKTGEGIIMKIEFKESKFIISDLEGGIVDVFDESEIIQLKLENTTSCLIITRINKEPNQQTLKCTKLFTTNINDSLELYKFIRNPRNSKPSQQAQPAY